MKTLGGAIRHGGAAWSWLVRAVGGWAGLGVFVVVALAIGGCESLQDASSWRDRAVVLRARVQDDLSRQQATQDALEAQGVPGDDPSRAQAARTAESLRTHLDALDAAVRDLDEAIAQGQSPSHPVTDGLETLSEALPEPLRSPVLLSGALVVALLRAGRLKSALTSVVQSIEKAKRDDEQFRKAFQQNAPTIRSIQTPTAQSIVASVTGEGFALRLPV